MEREEMQKRKSPVFPCSPFLRNSNQLREKINVQRSGRQVRPLSFCFLLYRDGIVKSSQRALFFCLPSSLHSLLSPHVNMLRFRRRGGGEGGERGVSPPPLSSSHFNKRPFQRPRPLFLPAPLKKCREMVLGRRGKNIRRPSLPPCSVPSSWWSSGRKKLFWHAAPRLRGRRTSSIV